MNGRAWTPEEIDKLSDMWGTFSPRAIGKALGRTEVAVMVRAQREGLGRPTPAGSLSGNEFMIVVGCTSHPTFRRWVDTGALAASRNTRTGSKRADWIITEPALIAFLRDHAHQVDRDDVDPAYRQYVPERWVTLPEAFRLGAAYPVLMESAVKAGLVPEARQRGEKGSWWVIPATILPRLIEGRRRMTSDPDHRRLVIAYDRAQRAGTLTRKRSRLASQARQASVGVRAA
jgi:hypothetical protein